jgi:hypothetical protein
MDILKLIETDHDEALELIERLEDMADEPSSEAEKLAMELATAILLHAKSEEKALYSKCMEEGEEHDDLKDFALESYIEHELLDITLQKFLAVKPGGNGQFKAHLFVLKDLIKHHGKEEEEQEMFPKFRTIFSEQDRAEMGEQMMQFKEQIRPQIEKSLAVMAPTQSQEKQAPMMSASKKPTVKTAPAKKMTMKSRAPAPAKSPAAKPPMKAVAKPAVKKAALKGKKKPAVRASKNLA